MEAATPAPVVGLTDVKQISVGRNLGTCALTKDGSVFCWGRNEFGQLGQDTTVSSIPVPRRLEGLPPASTIALGGAVGCAIAVEDGSLWCWGTRNLRTTWRDSRYSVGPIETFAPRQMAEFEAPIREIAIGSVHGSPGLDPLYNDTIMALRADGVLASHGLNPAGETTGLPWLPAPTLVPDVARLGTFAYRGIDGTITRWFPDSKAVHATGAPNVVDVILAPGLESTLAPYIRQAGLLLGDGHLYRWGSNIGGALGYPLDLVEIAGEPLDMTQVVGGRVVSFAMTQSSTCASLVDGKVKCWGSNQYGELGRGTIDFAAHPEAEVIQ